MVQYGSRFTGKHTWVSTAIPRWHAEEPRKTLDVRAIIEVTSACVIVQSRSSPTSGDIVKPFPGWLPLTVRYCLQWYYGTHYAVLYALASVRWCVGRRTQPVLGRFGYCHQRYLRQNGAKVYRYERAADGVLGRMRGLPIKLE